jgi:hypothetical protein
MLLANHLALEVPALGSILRFSGVVAWKAPNPYNVMGATNGACTSLQNTWRSGADPRQGYIARNHRLGHF